MTTAAEAAKLVGISRRYIFYARKIRHSGEADLIEAIEKGKMSIHAALRELDRRQHPETNEADRSWKRFVADWERLMQTLDKMGEERAEAVRQLKRAVEYLTKTFPTTGK